MSNENTIHLSNSNTEKGKILLVNSSPRNKGLTAALLNEFENKIKDLESEVKKGVSVERLQLSEFNISHCTGCDKCLRKPHECTLSEKDDMSKVEDRLKK